MTAPATTEPGWWRLESRRFVEVFALCGFAFTQPLLDLFGRAVEQFALRAASPVEIVGFAVAVTVLPAAALSIGGALTSALGRRVRTAVHALVLAGLVGATVVQAARPLATGPPLFALAVVVAVAGVAAYVRFAAVRLWLAFAALAPLGFLALFLLTSPSADLLREGAGAADVDVAAPAPVVVLVLDELPLESLIDESGDLDASLYPNLASFAGDAHWFRNTTTVAPATWHAVPAVLTGQNPEDGTRPVAGDHPENLFTLLGGSYDLQVTETVSRLCPVSLCPARSVEGSVWRGLAGDAARVLRSRLALHREADDPVSGFASLPGAVPEEGRVGDLTVPQPERFSALLDGLDDDPRTLHLLHLLLPHVPWRHLPDGATYATPSPDVGRSRFRLDRWNPEEWPTIQARQRHLLQLGYVDELLGNLMGRLREVGLYDDALVVITADHGISFEPDGPIRSIEGQPLNPSTTPDVLWVPFFVKEPGQTEGTVSDANVLTIDVVPTIADVLGVEIPWHVDGRSALGPPRSSADKPFYGNDGGQGEVDVAAPVLVDGHAVWPQVLARSAALFLPAGEGRDRLWRIGPSPELVGTAVDDLPTGRLEPTDVLLAEPRAFDDVHLEDILPLLVRGQLPEASPGEPLALVVNGVVAATGEAYPGPLLSEFAVVFDSRYLVAGRNDVRLYRIR